ncbi:hypothetical protein PPROV_001060200 [Pycnococcus provasolii]|uniref:Hsp90 chaperone protein kinase-targeting subunit n=1 Tax=Pycnococcus provasolii TaxID=41880 RepID=A0A830HZ54_9CHLO|nr:hypothetical protein PPROV_001060200 [Pycnococcus provasolii]
MTGFDYSKWDKLELSDDEDADPGAQFIEESFLRRIKHEQHEHKTADYLASKTQLETRRKEASELISKTKQLQSASSSSTQASVDDAQQVAAAAAAAAAQPASAADLAARASDLEAELADIDKKTQMLDKERKFNAEEFCQEAWSRTLIGKDAQPTGEHAADNDPANMRYEAYVAKYKDQLDHIVHLAAHSNVTLEECEELFRENTWIMSQSGMGYILLEALNFGMKDKFKTMKRVCKVLYHVKSILDYAEASKTLGPRDVARNFFRRLLDGDDLREDYWKTFDDFYTKLRDRSQQKKEEEGVPGEGGAGEEEEEYEEVPREERLGPGGLDPVEVFPTLPEGMQEAYHSGDPQKLRDFVASLSMEDARHHMKRMVDSGLWVPAPGEDPGAALRNDEGAD